MEKNFIDFFHVSEHVDHLKAIKVFSLRKTRKRFGLGVPPPPGFGKRPNYFRFFPKGKNFYCFKMIYMLRNMKKINKIFFQL